MSYPILAQRDLRWKDKSIGYSSETVGVSGCLFVSLLMMVCRDQPFLPTYIDSFMGCLKGHGNYTKAGEAYLQSFDVSACRPVEWGPCVVQNPWAHSYIGEDMPATELAALVTWLKSGQSALIEVDDRGAAATDVKATHRVHQHFVLAVGVNAAGAIVIHDPWHGDEATLTPRYGPTNEFAIYRAILYKTVATPAKTPKLTITPDKVVAGKSAVVSWSDTDGASAIRLNGAGVTGPNGSQTVNPGVTTKYTLTVTYPGGAVTTLEQTLTVTQAPASKPKLGYNFLFRGDKGGGVYNEGCRMLLGMNDTDGVNALAGLNDATLIMLYRQYWDHVPDMSEAVAALHPNRINKRVYRTGTNESFGFDSITSQARFDVELAKRLKDIDPDIIYCAGTIAMGCPDFTKQSICDEVYKGYADGYNSGLFYWDHHLYSPTMEWIYKGMPSMALYGPGEVVHMRVGRDQHDSTYQDPTRPVRTAIATFNDSPNYQSWYERRWEFLFTRCGFNPNIRHIVSGECGVDEGGVGGFPAHGATSAQVVAYAKRWVEVQSQPLIVNGVSYPTPMVGGAIFQLGDPNTGKGGWGGYAMDSYTAALKTAGVY